LVVPLVVMSFFGEKKVRYLLPLVAPAAVLGGAAFARHEDDERLRVKDSPLITPGRLAAAVTVAAALWLGPGLAITGAIGPKNYRTFDGHPWFSPATAVGVSIVTIGLLIGGLILSRRSGLRWLVSILAIAWIGAELKLSGDARSPGDPDDRPQRHLADDIWRTYPTATIYSADPPTLYGQLNRPAIVVSIYTNRVVHPKPDVLPDRPTGQPLLLITDMIGDEPAVPAGWTRWKVLPLRTGKRYVDVLN